ncbi:MAG: hypothetical protein JWQ09_494 [Segetibacter sp.]|nr:hypothetical protein [Segetibacter sp.]
MEFLLKQPEDIQTSDEGIKFFGSFAHFKHPNSKYELAQFSKDLFSFVEENIDILSKGHFRKNDREQYIFSMENATEFFELLDNFDSRMPSILDAIIGQIILAERIKKESPNLNRYVTREQTTGWPFDPKGIDKSEPMFLTLRL